MSIKYVTLSDLDEMGDNAKRILNGLKTGIRVRYTDPEFPTLQINDTGDWIDLKVAEDYELKAGESALLNLGVAMKLPKEYEAWLAPRSSTFNKYGLMQTNSIGIIDNSYSGDNDIWKMSVYATRDTKISKGDRLCQFRLVERMSSIFSGKAIPTSQTAFSGANHLYIIEAKHLDDTDRGGFGSTGK